MHRTKSTINQQPRSRSRAPACRAGAVYLTISDIWPIKIRPRAHVFAFRFEGPEGPGHAFFQPREITSYRSVCNSIARQHGAWLQIDEMQKSPKAWSGLIARCMRGAPRDADDVLPAEDAE
jgi:hypothetical protein